MNNKPPDIFPQDIKNSKYPLTDQLELLAGTKFLADFFYNCLFRGFPIFFGGFQRVSGQPDPAILRTQPRDQEDQDHPTIKVLLTKKYNHQTDYKTFLLYCMSKKSDYLFLS